MAVKMIAINTIVHMVEGKQVETKRGGTFEVDAATGKDLARSGAARFEDAERQAKVEDAPKDSVPASGNKSAATLVTEKPKSDQKA